jgi:hypothetical protein
VNLVSIGHLVEILPCSFFYWRVYVIITGYIVLSFRKRSRQMKKSWIKSLTRPRACTNYNHTCLDILSKIKPSSSSVVYLCFVCTNCYTVWIHSFCSGFLYFLPFSKFSKFLFTDGTVNYVQNQRMKTIFQDRPKSAQLHERRPRYCV